MNAPTERLPIHEDPFVLGDVLERFDFHMRQLETYAEQDDIADHNSRSLDAIKYNIRELFNIATSCNIPPIVEPLEILNKAFSSIKIASVEFPNLLQAAIAILERLQKMVHAAKTDGNIEFKAIQLVQSAIAPLAHISDDASLYKASLTVFNFLVGDFQANETDDVGVELFDEHPFFENKVEIPRRDVDRANFSFMRILSEAVDARQPHWLGRTEKLVSMAIGMNAIAENKVDVFQLEAAVYLHDFGMLKMNDELLSKQKLSHEEFKIISAHPAQGYELALSLPGLEECARITYQHHERVDGKGYPEGISGRAICDGAKILAICDAFFAMTHITAHKHYRKTILRAIVEINTCAGKQFDPFWVDIFNKVVRAQRLGGFL